MGGLSLKTPSSNAIIRDQNCPQTHPPSLPLSVSSPLHCHATSPTTGPNYRKQHGFLLWGHSTCSNWTTRQPDNQTTTPLALLSAYILDTHCSPSRALLDKTTASVCFPYFYSCSSLVPQPQGLCKSHSVPVSVPYQFKMLQKLQGHL